MWASSTARLDRLGDEFIGSQLEARDAVEILVAGGEEDDRRGGAPGAQFAADVEAVAPREHDVQHDEIRLQLVRAVDGEVAAALDVDLEAVLAEIFGDEVGEPRVVLDQQDALLGFHPGDFGNVHVLPP
jgi:hypothetical protein